MKPGISKRKAVASRKQQRTYQEALAVNAVVFFCIYVILHWLTSDEFNEKNEALIVVFSILRIIVGFGIIMPDKLQRAVSR